MSAYCDLVQQANAPEIDGGSMIVRHPHGVVAVCAPWNYPVEEIVLLCVPALIAGNSVVVKPSEVHSCVESTSEAGDNVASTALAPEILFPHRSFRYHPASSWRRCATPYRQDSSTCYKATATSARS